MSCRGNINLLPKYLHMCSFPHSLLYTVIVAEMLLNQLLNWILVPVSTC